MTPSRPEIAVVLDAGTPAGTELRDRLAFLEDIGTDAIYVGDHVAETAGPFATLGWLAAVTNLRLGTYVTCSPLRPPVEAAREAIAAARLSTRPLRLGFGAGWLISDLEAAGLEIEDRAARYRRLTADVEAAHHLLAGRPAGGTDLPWQVREPLPGANDVNVEIVLAATGPRMLAQARTAADVVALGPQLTPAQSVRNAVSGLSAAALEAKLRILDDGPGDGPARSLLVSVLRVGDRTTLTEAIGRAIGADAATTAESPHVLVGDTAWLVERIAELGERYRLSEIVFPETIVRRAAGVVRAVTASQ